MIEAAEQTVLQRSIPYERQGRVFGFAQLVENAAAPVTAFMIGPFAETIVMPSMTDGAGADAIGDWFGTGPDRGLALMFTLAGLIGIVVTLLVSAQPVLPEAERRAGRPAASRPHAGRGLVACRPMPSRRPARPGRRARPGCRWR